MDVIKFKISWWVTPYIHTVAWFAYLFGCQPDVERVARFICRFGIRIVR